MTMYVRVFHNYCTGWLVKVYFTDPMINHTNKSYMLENKDRTIKTTQWRHPTHAEIIIISSTLASTNSAKQPWWFEKPWPSSDVTLMENHQCLGVDTQVNNTETVANNTLYLVESCISITKLSHCVRSYIVCSKHNKKVLCGNTIDNIVRRYMISLLLFPAKLKG